MSTNNVDSEPDHVRELLKEPKGTLDENRTVPDDHRRSADHERKDHGIFSNGPSQTRQNCMYNEPTCILCLDERSDIEKPAYCGPNDPRNLTRAVLSPHRLVVVRKTGNTETVTRENVLESRIWVLRKNHSDI